MMRVLLLAGVVTVLGGLPPGGVAWAQQGGDTADGPLVDPSTPRLSAEDLQELVAPIALYPDTLLANMLAACVYPDDVKAAAAHVAAGKKLDDPAAGAWDPAVVTVAGVGEALRVLSEYPEWAESVGQAFLAQGADVMAAVQALRARAWANGALQSTPQQTVVTRQNTIVIEPAEPTVIYVPRYDPQVVYVERPSTGATIAAAVIGFGAGVVVGSLFADLDCDWRYGSVFWGWRRPYHRWPLRPNINININRPTINFRPGDSWRPRPDRPTTLPLRPRPGWAGRPELRPTPGRPRPGQLQGIGSGARPPFKLPGRPEGSRPIASPDRPAVGPDRPGVTRPTVRPGAPVTRPNLARPGATRPAPGAFPRPPASAQRPSTGATARPTRPAARPPSVRPAPRPAPRPSGMSPGAGWSRPRSRPAPRPSSRPAARARQPR